MEASKRAHQRQVKATLNAVADRADSQAAEKIQQPEEDAHLRSGELEQYRTRIDEMHLINSKQNETIVTLEARLAEVSFAREMCLQQMEQWAREEEAGGLEPTISGPEWLPAVIGLSTVAKANSHGSFCLEMVQGLSITLLKEVADARRDGDALYNMWSSDIESAKNSFSAVSTELQDLQAVYYGLLEGIAEERSQRETVVEELKEALERSTKESQQDKRRMAAEVRELEARAKQLELELLGTMAEKETYLAKSRLLHDNLR